MIKQDSRIDIRISSEIKEKLTEISIKRKISISEMIKKEIEKLIKKESSKK